MGKNKKNASGSHGLYTRKLKRKDKARHFTISLPKSHLSTLRDSFGTKWVGEHSVYATRAVCSNRSQLTIRVTIPEVIGLVEEIAKKPGRSRPIAALKTELVTQTRGELARRPNEEEKLEALSYLKGLSGNR